MNNTIKTLPAIAAILIAATLVVGVTFAATSATSAFAYPVKKGAQEDSKNGNTVTIQACKQRGSVSGFDNTLEQECQNLICTHPGSGATCVSEGSEVKPGTGTLLVKKVVVCKDDLIKQPPPPPKKCALPEDFTITVTGNNPNPAGPQPGSETGTLYTLGVGPYTVSETPLKGFDVSFSGDCPTGTIAPGDQKTCTITNTEQED